MAVEATFCFVDMAGFTALTEAHGDEDAAELATRFAELARAALGPSDRLVKTMGDAVLVTSPEPGAALDFVASVFERAACEAGFPVLRAGLHHGRAVGRGDDVFGSAVNVAARVAALARGDQVLATVLVADVARGRGLEVIELGPTRLRNVREPIALHAVTLGARSDAVAIDPVCRMRVSPPTAAGWLRHRGAQHWFCSLACAAAFAREPDAFACVAER